MVFYKYVTQLQKIKISDGLAIAVPYKGYRNSYTKEKIMKKLITHSLIAACSLGVIAVGAVSPALSSSRSGYFCDLPKTSQEDMQKTMNDMFSKGDADKSGGLNETEIFNYMQKTSFEALDKNKDGNINLSEYNDKSNVAGKGMVGMGMHMHSPSMIGHIISHLDQNGDKQVSLDEAKVMSNKFAQMTESGNCDGKSHGHHKW